LHVTWLLTGALRGRPQAPNQSDPNHVERDHGRPLPISAALDAPEPLTQTVDQLS